MKQTVLLQLVALVLMVYSPNALKAQDRAITGKVTSADDGSTLPGVNVLVKGTTTGTTTNAEGDYSISAPANATLVFSFVGLVAQEVPVGNRTEIDVILASDVQTLSEIVVTGVGVATDKRKLGISVESITAKDLPAAPTASVDQALVGKIAGAQISSTSGTPGADANIVLRGINTINRGTAPIVLIDGIQVAATNLNTIDLNSIERVEVVQGAASATIYGAQGANGVIQLFTKKGKSGQLNIDVSSSVANNTFLNVGDLRKAKYHAFVTDASNNVIGTSGNPLVLDPATLIYSENVQYNPLSVTSVLNKEYDQNLRYYDHFNFFFKPANTYNNSISLSGGSDKIDFIVGLSNNSQESNIVDNGSLSRTNLTSNLGLKVAKGLTFRSITQLAYTKSTLKSDDRNIMFSVNNARPFANFEQKDPDGDYGFYFGDAVGVNHWNPLYYQQYTNSKDNKVDVIQNFNLNYKFPKFVELDAKYGLNYQRQERIVIYPNQTENNNSAAAPDNYLSNFGIDNTGEIDNYSFNKTFQNFLATATLSTDFAKDFSINIPIKTVTQLAFDWRNTKYNQYITYGLGLPTYTPYTASQATVFRVPSADPTRQINDVERVGGDYAEPFVTYGYLVNQRLEFGDVAGISGGFRSDYSSAFGGGSKPFTFPRGDAYFRISSLGFWENSIASAVPEFKLRVAYGEAGIQPRPFDRYPTIGTKSLGSSNAFYIPYAQSNPDLNVEVSKELEVGTDFAFSVLKNTGWLNNVGLEVTYWKRSTDNAIYDVNVAPSAGIGTLKDNAFSLESRGLQASLNAQIYNSATFNWNFTTNFGKQTSEITSTNGQEIVVLSSAGSTNYVLRAGEKIGQLYGFIILNQVDALKPDGTPHIPVDEQVNYEVASNGYVVNTATKQPFFSSGLYSFGDPNPKFNMSFINDLTFKRFLTLSFQFDWVQGSHLYNQTKEWMYRDGIHSDYEKPITIGGETGAWTAFYRGIYAQRQANGTKNYFYEDASFVRLRNISVGIDLTGIIKIPAFRKLQLVLSGRNLLTFTDYSGMDPEASSGTNSSAWDRGTDHNTMPNYRSYQVGLNFGF
ncbi:SusC/RagA family TonB-linked outer membrane protein [Rhodocytophaga rosea]|uniref:SusC/RagA family TonB-linked outer membrane protein n=1 Tax=Rhodocytophaga rosea TaxID=2704465 RepID=A0A6C0GPJ4_9BACT|nr:SusC/RagA family TonB-linked outer membrane protein [Rhodocytophaga rosea]QHT69969.1 SusC/RagA family TonB-linked outer membrane protein [Rhodocytophaga rosea]